MLGAVFSGELKRRVSIEGLHARILYGSMPGAKGPCMAPLGSATVPGNALPFWICCGCLVKICVYI